MISYLLFLFAVAIIILTVRSVSKKKEKHSDTTPLPTPPTYHSRPTDTGRSGGTKPSVAPKTTPKKTVAPTRIVPPDGEFESFSISAGTRIDSWTCPVCDTRNSGTLLCQVCGQHRT